VLKELELSINERNADLDNLVKECDKWRTQKDLDLTKREARILNFCTTENVQEMLGQLVIIEPTVTVCNAHLEECLE
jgi:ribosomal protein S4